MINEILEQLAGLAKIQKDIQVHKKKSDRLIQRLVTKQNIVEGWTSRVSVKVEQVHIKHFLQFLIEVRSFLSKFTEKHYIYHAWKYNIDYEGFSDYNRQLIEYFQLFQLDGNLDVMRYQQEDRQDFQDDQNTILSSIEKVASLPTEITNPAITKEAILHTLTKQATKSAIVTPQASYTIDLSHINDMNKKITTARSNVASNPPSGDAKVGSNLRTIEPNALVCEKSHVNKLNDGKFGFMNYKGTYQEHLPVAIKYLPNMSASQLRTLQEELHVLQLLECEYLVKYFGVQQANVPYCIAFELINFTLYEALYSREKPQLVIAKEDTIRKLTILLECSIGLDYLHSLTLLHGDMKSSNVLIDTNGHIKLCGFGLLKTKQSVVPPTPSTANITAKMQALLLISSAQYLAPEIYDTNSIDSVTPESDIYAFGVLMNEVLDHAPPFPNLTASNIATRLKRSDNNRPLLFGRSDDQWNTGNGLLIELQSLIKRCWENTVHLRPISKNVYLILNRIMYGIATTEGGVTFAEKISDEEIAANAVIITGSAANPGGASGNIVANARRSLRITQETNNKQPVPSSPAKNALQRAGSRLKMIDFFESNIKRHAEANSTRPYPNNIPQPTTTKRGSDAGGAPSTPGAHGGITSHGTPGDVEDDSDDETNTNNMNKDDAEDAESPSRAPMGASIPITPAPVRTRPVEEQVGKKVEEVKTTMLVTPVTPSTPMVSTPPHKTTSSTTPITPSVSAREEPVSPTALEINRIDSHNIHTMTTTINGGASNVQTVKSVVSTPSTPIAVSVPAPVQSVSTPVTTPPVVVPSVSTPVAVVTPPPAPVVDTKPVPTMPLSPTTVANNIPTHLVSQINKLFYQASNCGSKSAQEDLIVLANQYQLAEVFLMGMLCYGSGIEKDLIRAQDIATKSIDWLLGLAQSNDHPSNMYAQYLTGICYEQGLGVRKDEREAVKYYTLSAEQGYAGAQSNLGYCYKHGQGVTRDMNEALRLYTLGAEQGHATAQNNLGYCYQHGQGIAKDLTKAVHYYKLSAEQGHATAQNNLGYCYQYGQGVAPDIHAAVKLYRQSADQGCAFGQNSLGHCYKRGHGVPKNLHEAVKYYRLSAEQGHATAQNNLGYCYQYGQGVEKDLQQAVAFYKQSAEQGHATAQNNLGYCYQHGYGVPKSLKDAARYYQLSAEQGYAAAQFNLGHCYINGIGVERNYSEAVKLFRYSAEQGNASAQYNLGHCYELGQGIEKNKQEAIRWYQAAAERGDEAAITALKKLTK